MSKIGFRLILPVLFTVVQVLLAVYTWEEEPRLRAEPRLQDEYRSVAYQEGGAPPTKPISDRPTPTGQKIAILVNLPALFPAALIAGALFPQHDIAGLLLATLFVPFVWYAVGSWLDGMLGYRKRMCVPRVIRTRLAIVVIALLFISIAGFTPAYHDRTRDSNWVFTGGAIWSALSLFILLTSPEAAVTTSGSARPGAPSPR